VQNESHMRALTLICLAFVLGASRLAGAQTLDEANRYYERRDYGKAREILEKLSAQGITEAEFKLAGMYVDAVGIPRNTQRGLALYESAGRKGHSGALFFLATELANGVLMPPDKKRSVALLRTAAKLKHAGAQVALCMELSSDFSKYYDAVEGYAWCETASKKSHKLAGDAVRRAKDTLEKIQSRQGAAGVLQAKAGAARYAKEY
jgi:TPR repeat protein